MNIHEIAVEFPRTQAQAAQAAATAASAPKVYRALLTQSGTNAPVATVLENTLGGTVAWTREDAGVYVATLAAVFGIGKTVAKISPYSLEYDGFNAQCGIRDLTVNSFRVLTQDAFVPSDGLLNSTWVEILVYP